MMLLTAIILLIGFIALAGMVSRVSLLAQQAGREQDRPLLREVEPLQKGLNDAISPGIRTVADMVVTSGSTTITSATAGFSQSDVGSMLTGTGIPSLDTIASVTSSTTALMTVPATASQNPDSVVIEVQVHQGLNSISGLYATPYTAYDVAVKAVLEQMRELEAGRGFIAKWTMECNAVATPQTGYATLSLSDGELRVTLRSATFNRPTTCATYSG